MREVGVAVGCLAASLGLTAILVRADPWLVGGLLAAACGLAAWGLCEDA